MHNALSLRRGILIGLLAVFAALAGVFTMPVLDSDEARYAQASAQMAQSGDYLHIRFLNKVRNAKPAGIYWMQAASAQLFGQVETRHIWAWRLPSALGAVLAALALYWGGSVLVGERAAFWGALLLAPSLLLASEGGIAKTDAMLVGLTTLAMGALAHVRHGGTRRAALIFWGALGGAMLIKGPVAPLIAAFALFILWHWERDARWMRPLAYWPGPVLALLMVVPWLVLMQIGSQGAFLQEALGGDLLPKLWQAKEGHWGFPGQHFTALVLLLFPASIFLPTGIAHVWRGRKELEKPATDWRFLVVWILPWWVLVEVVPTKLVHYPLPVYPALALIAGLGVCSITKARWSLWTGTVLALSGPVLMTVLTLMLVRISGVGGAQGVRALFVLMAPAFALALMTSWTMVRHKRRASAVLAIGSALAIHIAIRAVFLPSLGPLAPSHQLAERLRTYNLLPATRRDAPLIAVTGYSLPSLAFLTGGAVWYTSAEGAARALAQGHPVVVENRQRAAFDGWAKVLSLHSVTLGVVQGYNYTKGQSIRVAIIVPKQETTRDEPHH